tara:strand:- start:2021 stop:2584 length:564 start_codon:yes stop_codon:yes gene_type:complete
MAEAGCLKDGSFQNLQVGGTLIGNKKPVTNITGTTTVLLESQSGTMFTINVTDAATITLPEISATNIGTYYEFFLGTENTNGVDILTATTHDTTGDTFVGALQIGINAAWGASDAQDDGVFYLLPGGDDNQINMTGTEANGGGEVGSYLRCVAISYSSSGHSTWHVTGVIGTDDPDGTGAAIFVDRD